MERSYRVLAGFFTCVLPVSGTVSLLLLMLLDWFAVPTLQAVGTFVGVFAIGALLGGWLFGKTLPEDDVGVSALTSVGGFGCGGLLLALALITPFFGRKDPGAEGVGLGFWLAVVAAQVLRMSVARCRYARLLALVSIVFTGFLLWQLAS